MSVTNITIAIVDITIQNNQTFNFAFAFGLESDLSWSFDDQTLYMDIKSDAADETPFMSYSSESGGGILILDSATRSIQFDVSDDELRAALPPDTYRHDLIMVDNNTGDTVPLWKGSFKVEEGVTKKPEP